MSAIPVQIIQLPHASGLPLPSYESLSAAGLDLRAAIEDAMTIFPGTTSAVPTGLKIALPIGYEAQVRPRSGLALKHSIGVINSPGTVDSDYRGEVMVLLTNFGSDPFTLHRGDRIAQMVVARHERIEWQPVVELSDTPRGEGGFGHTGNQ